MKTLHGHTTPDTALVIDDYPKLWVVVERGCCVAVYATGPAPATWQHADCEVLDCDGDYQEENELKWEILQKDARCVLLWG